MYSNLQTVFSRNRGKLDCYSTLNGKGYMGSLSTKPLSYLYLH